MQKWKYADTIPIYFRKFGLIAKLERLHTYVFILFFPVFFNQRFAMRYNLHECAPVNVDCNQKKIGITIGF